MGGILLIIHGKLENCDLDQLPQIWSFPGDTYLGIVDGLSGEGPKVK